MRPLILGIALTVGFNFYTSISHANTFEEIKNKVYMLTDLYLSNSLDSDSTGYNILTKAEKQNLTFIPITDEELKKRKEAKDKCLTKKSEKEKAECYVKYVLSQLALSAKLNNQEAIYSRYCDIVSKETNLTDIASEMLGFKANKKGEKRCLDEELCIWKHATKEQKERLVKAIHTKFTRDVFTSFLPLSPFPFELVKTKKKKLHNLKAFKIKTNFPEASGKKKFTFIATTTPLLVYDLVYLGTSLRTYYYNNLSGAYQLMSGSKEEKVEKIIEKIIRETEPIEVSLDPVKETKVERVVQCSEFEKQEKEALKEKE